ncbi:hypothetical protein AaE_014389 [Aphanomyces astaci]|uniref:Uncharacterized protein n=1 Tax=Aphanomyces astaci TaxID=112090 RepID=A0A6A4ZE92_APHAT|nr:hypothetical protein AaE_014389 [Aphanomyces astaci]
MGRPTDCRRICNVAARPFKQRPSRRCATRKACVSSITTTTRSAWPGTTNALPAYAHGKSEDGKEEEKGEEGGGDKGKYANKPALEAGSYQKNRGTQRSQGRCAGKTYGDCCDWDDQCEFLGGDFYCMEVGLCETDYDTAFDCGIDTNCNPLGGKSKRYAQ